MQRFTLHPEKVSFLEITHEGAKKIASKLISAYAEHLQRNPHLTAVNAHMVQPDDFRLLLE